MVPGDTEPDVGPVLEATASALARLVQPDLSTLPADQVDRARAAMFGPEGLRPEYLDELRRDVSDASGGRVTLQDADPSTFPYLSKEWGAKYLRLSGTGVNQLLILGNTNPLAQFVSAPS
jgi:hypothetical protein